jgi:protein-L-isoaspartate(D-aspartate) O-methyltransferase
MRLLGRDREPGRFARRREAMVREQLTPRGIRDPNVLAAMRAVPRERFVPAELVERAYADGAQMIGAGQTISQPYIVARMSEALRLAAPAAAGNAADEATETASEPRHRPRVLEIGTGSGYQAAILATMGASVVTVERDGGLMAQARERLAELGYVDVRVEHGDGSAGWPADAPYDAILVAAACPEAPEPLLAELADGGRLVAPIGSRELQELTVVRRVGQRLETEVLEPCVFVPLIGRFGFAG